VSRLWLSSILANSLVHTTRLSNSRLFCPKQARWHNSTVQTIASTKSEFFLLPAYLLKVSHWPAAFFYLWIRVWSYNLRLCGSFQSFNIWKVQPIILHLFEQPSHLNPVTLDQPLQSMSKVDRFHPYFFHFITHSPLLFDCACK